MVVAVAVVVVVDGGCGFDGVAAGVASFLLVSGSIEMVLVVSVVAVVALAPHVCLTSILQACSCSGRLVLVSLLLVWVCARLPTQTRCGPGCPEKAGPCPRMVTPTQPIYESTPTFKLH
jgi:hypothetical protein